MNDEHPVKFVREALQGDGAMLPLKTWIVQRFPGALVPEAGKMMDPWWKQRTINKYWVICPAG